MNGKQTRFFFLKTSKHYDTTDVKLASRNELVSNVTPELLPVRLLLITAPCWWKLYDSWIDG